MDTCLIDRLCRREPGKDPDEKFTGNIYRLQRDTQYAIVMNVKLAVIT